MIVSRTPFRVTLGGGGTDLPSYYQKHGGFVLAMGIDKYMYVTINAPPIDRKIRVKYTKTEVVDHPGELRHELVRKALERHGILSRMEISSIADLRAGTGLGSSSCYLVGLLMALRSYKRDPCSLAELAEEACSIELDELHKGIGKQDQYMAVYGGVTVLDIARDGTVTVRRAAVDSATWPDFLSNTQLYWTGVRRSAPEMLRDQDEAMRSPAAPSHEVVQDALHGIKDCGYRSLEAIEAGNYDEYGQLMDRHWQLKKQLSPKITIPGIDELYQELRKRFGILGAKVSGAGGGGFLMVYAPKEHGGLAAYLGKLGLERMHYRSEYEGAKIVCNLSRGGLVPIEPHPPQTSPGD